MPSTRSVFFFRFPMLIGLLSLFGCKDDSGSTNSTPSACDTDCDPDTSKIWVCECDVNLDGTYCDPSTPAAGQGGAYNEDHWCTDSCILNTGDPGGDCYNYCNEADTFDTTFQSKPYTVSCMQYPNSGTCSGWSPSSHISLVGGVYNVNAVWFASVVASPAPLWTCDDAYFEGLVGGGFQLFNASSGELLYVLGLRNNDKPLSVNGLSVGNYQQVIVTFGRLYASGVINYTVVVHRGTTNVTLRYKLV